MQSPHSLASVSQGTLPADAGTAEVSFSSSVPLQKVRNNWLPRSRLSLAAGLAICFAVLAGAIGLRLSQHSGLSV